MGGHGCAESGGCSYKLGPSMKEFEYQGEILEFDAVFQGSQCRSGEVFFADSVAG